MREARPRTERKRSPLGCIRVCHSDSSGEFRRLFALSAARSGSFLLCGSTADGREAERLVREQEPDVLVTSLTLQFIDGMELIARVRRLPRRPKVLVLSHLVRDFCIEEAMRLGADYFMLKPCVLPVVFDRMRELAELSDAAQSAVAPGVAPPDLLVQALLRRMGLSPELSGYRYAAEAVRLLLLQGGASMSKELYPQVASAFHVSAPAVERAIRHAVDRAWRRPGSPSRRSLFPGPDKPGNSRFLLRIASACETSSLESEWPEER